MTTTAIHNPSPVESIPDPATIRARLDEIRSEARILRELLPVAERRQRLATRQIKQPEVSKVIASVATRRQVHRRESRRRAHRCVDSSRRGNAACGCGSAVGRT